MILFPRVHRFGLTVHCIMAAIALPGLSVRGVAQAQPELRTPSTASQASNSLPPKSGPQNPADAKSSAEGKSLFDGKTLSGWKPSAFDTQREVKVENPFRGGPGAIVLETSDYLSGITYTNDVPRMNYEISLEAMKLKGSDFFCGLTFPVGKTACTFVVGGWGGTVTGLSTVDHSDASENDTTQSMEFSLDRWYRIRVRVTPEKIEAWIDDTQMVDLETKDRIIDLRFGDIKHSLPLGIAAFQTRAALRDIRLRRL
jgi:hypothetical protein